MAGKCLLAHAVSNIPHLSQANHSSISKTMQLSYFHEAKIYQIPSAVSKAYIRH